MPVGPVGMASAPRIAGGPVQTRTAAACAVSPRGTTMPEPVDSNTAQDGVDVEQPGLRRRRDRRRSDESDAWTGTMPIITHNEAGSEAARTVRSASWAEAAAAADAPQAPTRAPADTSAPIDSVPAAPGPVRVELPAAPGTAPSVPPMPVRSRRAGSRAAALAGPAPGFHQFPWALCPRAEAPPARSAVSAAPSIR